jgi:imidazole glycerol-phosphate synthase subunit HisH
MTAVVIVDLGLGNLRSVARAFEREGATATVASDPDAVRRAGRLVVPGQGAFRDAARALAGGLGDAVREHVGMGRPYLGICLGMQALFEGSDEAPEEAGLGLFEGRVVRFAEDMRDRETGERLKVPHMGWNEVSADHPLMPAWGWFYFVHSYHCVPVDETLVVGRAEYGVPFAAAIGRDNLFACQFHPEKSHQEGQRVIQRFLTSWT